MPLKEVKIHKLTVQRVMSYGPCAEYPESLVRELWAGRRSLKPAEVLDLDIPDEHKRWLLLRDGVIPQRIMREWACRCAARALTRERKAGRTPHPDSLHAIRVARAWCRGRATDEGLSAAESAAKSAESAAWSAAKSAAESAA